VVIDTGPTETRQNKPLFRVDDGVRPKNNLTEPALLEMSGCATNRDLCAHLANATPRAPSVVPDAIKPKLLATALYTGVRGGFSLAYSNLTLPLWILDHSGRRLLK
jgi:hypothetical protein